MGAGACQRAYKDGSMCVVVVGDAMLPSLGWFQLVLYFFLELLELSKSSEPVSMLEVQLWWGAMRRHGG